MITIMIPGQNKELKLQHLVLDYNGTLAVDGILLPGVREKLVSLSSMLDIHVLTADTFGLAGKNLEGLPCSLLIMNDDRQAEGKAEFVCGLMPKGSVVSMGNGMNDHLMFKESGLSVAVMQAEGVAAKALQMADIVCPDILSALSLLDQNKRLVATLRR